MDEDVNARPTQRVHVTTQQSHGACAVAAPTMFAYAPVADVGRVLRQLDADRSQQVVPTIDDEEVQSAARRALLGLLGQPGFVLRAPVRPRNLRPPRNLPVLQRGDDRFAILRLPRSERHNTICQRPVRRRENRHPLEYRLNGHRPSRPVREGPGFHPRAEVHGTGTLVPVLAPTPFASSPATAQSVLARRDGGAATVAGHRSAVQQRPIAAAVCTGTTADA